jgi:hypothetical protein
MRWVRLIANLPLKLPRKNFELRGALAKHLLFGFDILVLGLPEAIPVAKECQREQ